MSKPRGYFLRLGVFALSLGLARAETLTIAAYNVENYAAAHRVTEVGFRKDYPKPEAEKAALRTVIRGLGADVLVLEEMGAQPYLDELRRDLKSAGLDYPHSVLLEGPDAERYVVLLSRRPLKDVRLHTQLEFSYFGAKELVRRGLLEATVATAGGDVTLFGLHLTCRYTDRPEDPLSSIRRVGEAAAIRDAILQRFPDLGGARFVILGDFNDGKASKAVQRLLQRDKTDVAVLLPASDSKGETWTHRFRKDDTYTRVDHILVLPGL